MNTNVRFLMAVAATIVLSSGAQADEQQDAKLFQEKVMSLQEAQPKAAVPIDERMQVRAIKAFQEKAAPQTKKCVDAKKINLTAKHVLSFDSEGQPCRIYDLSFPTLRSASGRKATMEVPVLNVTAKDYLNWLNKNYSAVYQRIDDFQKNASPDEILKNSWVGSLKFRRPVEMVGGAKALSGGLPRTFRASDLDIGTGFKFSAEQKANLKGLLASVKADTPDLIENAFWSETIDNPEKVLEKVRFNWNDVRKVYEIFLEGEFLPITGPVALVDYKVQYKFAVEKMIRSLMVSMLRSLAGFIPHPLAQNLVDVAITDTFDFVEMMYTYQMNQLEDTLRTALDGQLVVAGVETAHLNKGMNILFGSRSDLITQYIMSMVQGQTFNWDAMDKLGRMSRYSVEKQRDILMSRNNSALVLKDKCSVKRMGSYFAVCARNNKKEAVYSLVSDMNILFWNLGAPMVHRYSMSSEVLLKRSVSWLLAIGVRLAKIPFVPMSVNRYAAGILKNYSTWGLNDEAFLRNQMSMQIARGTRLDPENQNIYKWLYFQNMNPFLPHAPESENSVVQANASFMN